MQEMVFTNVALKYVYGYEVMMKIMEEIMVDEMVLEMSYGGGCLYGLMEVCEMLRRGFVIVIKNG